MSNNNLQTIIDSITHNLETADSAREKALPLHRQVIRQCSLAVRAIHRREFDEARTRLSEAKVQLDEISSLIQPHPEVCYAGFLQDAQKEFAEASLTLAIVTQNELPTPQELNMGEAPYVNGLAECIGELRRHSLDRMRLGEMLESERRMEVRDAIFCALTTLDFPDGLTRGLRRNTDIARGCLEKTRGELTASKENQRLIAQMNLLRSSVLECSHQPAPNH